MEYPWYDAIWLGVYARARSIVANQRPERLAEFEAAFEPLQAPESFSTRRLQGLISRAQLNELSEMIRNIARETVEPHEFLSFGREVVHDHPALSDFQDNLIPLVSELADEPLIAGYNFISLYHNLGICEPHLDAPTSKWTLDICVDQSAPWPIHVSDPVPWPLDVSFGEDWQSEIVDQHRDHITEYVMNPGDALFFAGSNQWHYRDRIPRTTNNNFCHLIFLHYVPVDCEHLLEPARWPDYFNLPELEALADLFDEYQHSQKDLRGVSMLSLLDAMKKTGKQP